MARNALWQCLPFLWHAAWRERGLKTCLRPVRALYTHLYAQFTQCANRMTAISTQWNDLFTHTSRCLCAPPRIAPTTSCMCEFVVAFFSVLGPALQHAIYRGFTHSSTHSNGKMVNVSRYYRARLESVSTASALSTALTIYPCQIRVHQTLTVLNSNFLQLGRSGGRPQQTVYPRRLPVN